jgi:hypothetical protein
VRLSRRTRLLRALLVAPVLVFALGASSHSAVRCTMTGLLMPENSCSPAVADLAQPAPAPRASIDEAGCCEWVTVTTARIPATGSELLRSQPIQPQIAHAILPSRLLAERPSIPPPADRRAVRPPGTQPPLYVVNHAFLI